MCMRSTLCSGDKHTTGIPTKSAEKQANLGSYSIPTQLMSPSHDNGHAITPYLGNKVICDWHISNVHSSLGVETRDV